MRRRTIVVDGLVTSYLEAGAGNGDPLVLLHGGEFGAGAELGWERTIPALAERHHVLAPDQLGYGQTAKVVDLNAGRHLRIRHVARFCEAVGVDAAGFVGNSMGGVNLLVDQASEQPLLPVRRLVVIGGGGEILRNPHSAALVEYDATLEAMRRIVEALFADPAYAADDAYVRRRYEASIAPGAWEAVAAARLCRPGLEPSWLGAATPPYERIAVPTLIVEGGQDKIKPDGCAAQVAARIPGAGSTAIDGAGHCPQIERPDLVNPLLLDFFAAVAPA